MTKKAAISGRISQGSTGIVFTALMAKVTTMPASMPEATDAGIFAISRVSGLNRPVTISMTATTMKAPTASAMVKPVLAATSAAPGVDQAVMTGIFVRQESHRLSTAMARQMRGDPACGLDLCRADRIGCGDDQRQRAAEADDRRHECGDGNGDAHAQASPPAR